MDRLAALNILERRYDGPIPPHALAVARLGSEEAVRKAQAQANARFFATLARGCIRGLRKPLLIEDRARLVEGLRFYLGERRRHLRIVLAVNTLAGFKAEIP